MGVSRCQVRVHIRMMTMKYFTDMLLHNTLFMMQADGEFQERTSKHFDFHFKRSVQMGSILITYSWGDPVSVTQYVDPHSEVMLKVIQMPPLEIGLAEFSVTIINSSVFLSAGVDLRTEKV